MKPHPYHLQLMKESIRKKMKGDHRIPLTHYDRKELVEKHGVTISVNHIHKVLSDSEKAQKGFYQHTLNELVRYIGYEDWNAFIRDNQLPEQY